MQKEKIEIVKKHIIRRFMNKSMIGMNYVNRHNIKVKQIGGDVVQKAIDELIKDNFLETHHIECISINPRMLRSIGEYIDQT